MKLLLNLIYRTCLYVVVWYLQVCLSAIPSGAQPLRVHLVAHSHDDAGWLKTVDQYYTGSEQRIQHAGVEYVLDSVVQCLGESRNRTFSFGEIAFFSRWWTRQAPETQAKVHDLVSRGQLTFVNGGWVQHDEATSHFAMMTDQTTRGHDFLLRTFNFTPSIAWQIDPFGHSSTQASLLTARAGFDAVFFARADYDDLSRRKAAGQAEAVWRAAPETYGTAGDIFLGNFPNHYGPPRGFNFEWGSTDPPVQDDPRLEGYNAVRRADALIDAAQEYVATSRGADVMILMGSDFTYSNALTWYKNMDRLIAAINAGGRAHAEYSTPERYLAAKAAYGGTWPLRTDDLYPYADSPHTYWAGFFSSRPTLKHYIYDSAHILATARKATALLTLHGDCGQRAKGLRAALDSLDAAVALTQHHDAVTGTAKQAVTNDYARRLSAASAAVHRHIANLISAAIFTPHSCTSCMSSHSPPSASELSEFDPAQRSRFESETTTAAGRDNRNEFQHRAADARDDGSVQEAGSDSIGEAIGGAGAGRPDVDGLPRLWPCEQGNMSACAATVEASRACESFAVVLFNSAAWPREENVPLARPDCHYAAVDANSQEVLLGVLPISQATWCVQQLLSLYDALPSSAAGWYEAVFQAAVPALGYSTVLLIPNAAPAALALNATLPDMHALDSAAVSTAVSYIPLPDDAHAWHDEACPECAAVALRAGAAVARLAPTAPALPGAPAIVENEHLSLRFDRVTGRLVSIVHKETGQRVRVDVDLVYWESKKTEPFGGAYIMRPGAQVPLAWSSGSSRATLEVVESPVVSEVRQAFVGWGTVTTRLWRGARAVEVEWTVGPVPVTDGIGKEVALRLRTDLDTGDLWWTDSNGRQMQRRRRSWRRSWPLNNTEPVAGNFYPITSVATLRGAPPPGARKAASSEDGGTEGKEFELSLVTDRPQGAASLESGSMHVLLHRRLLTDDNRGVAEPLNETVCGCRECDCPGLVARGTFQIHLAPRSPDSHRTLRTIQTLAAEPPLPLYGRGTDIVRWLTAHMHEGRGGEVAVGGGTAVEDVAAAATPSGAGGTKVGSNTSDLWPVGASELIASNPLAKAVLKRIGDNGVVRIETSATEYPRGNTTNRRGAHQRHTSAPQLLWSATVAPHKRPCHGLACSTAPHAVMPPGLSLLSFSRWHGAIFVDSPSGTSGCGGSACGGGGLEWPEVAHACPGHKEQFYLVRVASTTDPEDLRAKDPAEVLQSHTVNLCQLLSWPAGAALRVRETTLSGNRGLRAFAAAGGRRRFTAQSTPQCFKDDEGACGTAERPQRSVCGDVEAIDTAGVDCSGGSVSVCVDAMDVRTFVVGVKAGRG